ncbi:MULTISPECIES: undecaprenyl-diphosphate phosphatase [Hymenobacter]|uniref:Undecaprenyl-diphosphatase n=1 Tax=Hymenobacter guriensis TaxID=2793065 RepID=A0ABS0L5E2_9BACT|nr:MULTISPECIES: undecaprenyl-diphosphate phosphatase [Hymenobacter]MBG8555369.1 undecaprenyl-diphosphate phosphatase [Hymenobacter guriensis]MCR5889003.1 undecaprenyl-diphosphate phosphatase [Hymenobacter sp. J193]
MSYWHALLLAIIEGLTEFLPVSSTGHMIIVANLLGIGQLTFTDTYITSIQLGAILSVVVLYWRRFVQSFDFYLKLAVAFVPFGILGFLLKDVIESLLKNVAVVAWALLVGGVVLVFIDKVFSGPRKEVTTPNFRQALKIGLFQCLALVPGVSRSAATIVGGLAQGFDRRSAADFSFLLAVPTMFVITAYQLYKTYKIAPPGAEDLKLLLFGNVVAFIVALLAVKTFVDFVSRFGFRAFGLYRIVVGVVILVMMALGIDLHVL